MYFEINFDIIVSKREKGLQEELKRLEATIAQWNRQEREIKETVKQSKQEVKSFSLTCSIYAYTYSFIYSIYNPFKTQYP